MSTERVFRVFVEGVEPGKEVALRSEDAAHLHRVLRTRAGQVVTVFDGAGGEGRARLVALQHSGGTAMIEEAHRAAPPEAPRVTLALAVVRPEAMADAVRQATELGAHALRPLVAEYTARREALAWACANVPRWERLVTESLKQCRRAWRMEVLPPLPSAELFRQAGPARRLLLDPGALPTLGELLLGPVQPWPEIVAAVGPEGGWSEAETQSARAGGFESFSLGPSILRTETAALAALALIMARYHWTK